MSKVSRNTTGIENHNKEYARRKEKDVLNAINRLHKQQGKFTLAELCREAEVSRSYFTKHPDMRKVADKYIKPTGRAPSRSQDSKDALIQMLKKELSDLKKVNDKLIKERAEDGNYKAKYEQALREIKALKEELEGAYANCLPTTF